jgi:hypothetical protein
MAALASELSKVELTKSFGEFGASTVGWEKKRGEETASPHAGELIIINK